QVREWDGGPNLGSSNAMAWDPTGQKLATCLGNPPHLRIRNVTTGQETLALKDPVLSLYSLSWSPYGKRLAYLADGRTVVDLATRQIIELAERCERMVWKPDGSQLALFNPAFGSGEVGFYDAATGQVLPGERGVVRPDPATIRERTRGVEGSNFHLQSVI